MSTFKTRVVKQGLIRKGFVTEQNDHEKFYYMTHGSNPRKTEVWTFISHQSKGVDIDTGLIKLMAKQCRISRLEFEQLFQCNDGFCGSYDTVLKKKGVRFPEHEPDGKPACRSAIRGCRVDGEAKGSG